MNALLKKLNYREGLLIYCKSAPAVFRPLLEEGANFLVSEDAWDHSNPVHFAVIFVMTEEEIGMSINEVEPLLEGDAVLWMVYPKKSSKRYKTTINRDYGWSKLGECGMEGVRMVAIDEDWSALRFRKTTYIKTLKRKFSALSDEGKKRTGQG